MKPNFWLIRVPQDEETLQRVQSEGIVAVGFRVRQDLSNLISHQEFRKVCNFYNTSRGDRERIIAACHLHRLVREVKLGDWVLTPENKSYSILCGKVIQEYHYLVQPISPGLFHAIQVEWLGEIARDVLDNRVKHAMVGASGVLNLGKFSAELTALLSSSDFKPVGFFETKKTQWMLKEAILEGLTAERLKALGESDFNELVLGLLDAMGYRVFIGRERLHGVLDILCIPKLSLDSPKRLRVWVSPGASATYAPRIHRLAEHLAKDEEVLLISKTAFHKSTKDEVENFPGLRLFGGEDLVELMNGC